MERIRILLALWKVHRKLFQGKKHAVFLEEEKNTSKRLEKLKSSTLKGLKPFRHHIFVVFFQALTHIHNGVTSYPKGAVQENPACKAAKY